MSESRVELKADPIMMKRVEFIMAAGQLYDRYVAEHANDILLAEHGDKVPIYFCFIYTNDEGGAMMKTTVITEQQKWNEARELFDISDADLARPGLKAAIACARYTPDMLDMGVEYAVKVDGRLEREG